MKSYRLVVFGSDWDVYTFAFKDFIDNPRITYIPTFRPRGIAGHIHRVMFNPRINRFLPFPFKRLWNSLYVPEIKDENVCFLFLENWLRWESATNFLPYLRRRYPKAQIIYFLQDLVSRIKDLYTQDGIDIDYVKRYTDLIVTYDLNDASRYNLSYSPTVFSPISITGCSDVPHSDLYFLGRDKGRLELLLGIHNIATRLGLTTAFFILQVPKEKQVHLPGIYYIDKPMSYEMNLKYVSKTRCIVELLQPEALGATFRLWEAIVLNKKLLTNNHSIASEPCYDSKYISTFNDDNDIDWGFVRDKSEAYAVNPFRSKIMPDTLIQFIEQELHITINR